MNKWQRAARVQQYSTIDSHAAAFMLMNYLSIRNSNTHQVPSRHYGQGQYPNSHGIGADYAVPIWTVAIWGLELSTEYGANADRIERKINQFNRNREACGGGPKLDLALVGASAEAQAAHFANYVDLVKAFMMPYTAFGRDSFDFYDYELLVVRDQIALVNDYGRYPTGGRSQPSINGKTIAYRITFNELEIALFKAVLRGEHDQECFSVEQQRDLSEDVKTSARMMLCNQLATEIIVAKLLMWLNTGGRCQKVIALDEADRMILLKRAMKNRQEEILQVMANGWIYKHVDRLDTYLATDKSRQNPPTPEEEFFDCDSGDSDDEYSDCNEGGMAPSM